LGEIPFVGFWDRVYADTPENSMLPALKVFGGCGTMAPLTVYF